MKVGSEEETSQALETIRFRDISEKYNDSNSFVMLALLATKEDSKEIEEGLKNFGFLGQKSKITKMFDIVGDKKVYRHDVLVVVEKAQFNGLVRLRTNDIKWTDDFIHNYRSDYMD